MSVYDLSDFLETTLPESLPEAPSIYPQCHFRPNPVRRQTGQDTLSGCRRAVGLKPPSCRVSCCRAEVGRDLCLQRAGGAVIGLSWSPAGQSAHPWPLLPTYCLSFLFLEMEGVSKRSCHGQNLACLLSCRRRFTAHGLPTTCHSPPTAWQDLLGVAARSSGLPELVLGLWDSLILPLPRCRPRACQP